MNMDEIQTVLAEATKVMDRIVSNLHRDYGIESSRYQWLASSLREARRALAEMEDERYTITDKGRAMLKGGE